MSRRRTSWPQTKDRALGMVEMLVLAGWQRDDAERRALAMTMDLEALGFMISRIPESPPARVARPVIVEAEAA